jgi:hypothetical protein
MQNELAAFPEGELTSCRLFVQEVGGRVDELDGATKARSEVAAALRALGPEL